MVLLSLYVLAVLAGACYADSSNRIVGGQDTSIEKYPSIVAIERRLLGQWSQMCAASILNSRFVLSAAHCFHGPLYHPINRRIRAGTSFRNAGGYVGDILQEFNHPSYGVAPTYDGDISVVQLTLALPLTGPTMQQGRIIAQGVVIPANLPVVHAGWGATSTGGLASNVLQDVTIYTIDRDLCRERYANHLTHPEDVTENMICAGILDVGGKDACQGDSGGPMYWDGIIIGVVSWGWECANDTYPGVSTSVNSYTDWIVSVAN